LSLNSEELIVAATVGSSLYLYDIRSIQKGETKPFKTWSAASKSDDITQIRWNPTDPNLIAVVTQDYTTYTVDIRETGKEKILGLYSAVGWHPNGKKLALGTSTDVYCMEYPDTGKVELLQVNTLNDVMYIHWVDEDSIFVGCREKPDILYILTLSADGHLKSKKVHHHFCFCPERNTNFFLAYVPEWSIVITLLCQNWFDRIILP
jgi:WD40 repeat protein